MRTLQSLLIFIERLSKAVKQQMNAHTAVWDDSITGTSTFSGYRFPEPCPGMLRHLRHTTSEPLYSCACNLYERYQCMSHFGSPGLPTRNSHTTLGALPLT